MAKAIGIDYGTKRVGIAISDSSKIIASALCTITNKEIFIFLIDLFKKEEIDTFVVGESKNLNGEETDSTKDIHKFIEKLHTLFPKIEIHTIDERFTSKMAFQSMIDGGLKKKVRQNKALIDEISATIILQSYLDSL